VGTLAEVSTAALRFDIGKILIVLKTTVVENQNLSRDVSDLAQLLTLVESALNSVPKEGVDKTGVLGSMLDLLKRVNDEVQNVAKARKAPFGYFLAQKCIFEVKKLRQQLLETINVLTLAFVAEDKYAAKNNPSGEFQASRFFDENQLNDFGLNMLVIIKDESAGKIS